MRPGPATRRQSVRYPPGIDRIPYKINAKAQAQAELIALAANLGDDPEQQTHLGNLFIQIQDYEHALAAFRQSLKSDLDNSAALAGAGQAAFKLGRYPLAEKYLGAAIAANPNDTHSSAELETTRDVLQLDPFRHSTPGSPARPHRNRGV